MEPAKIGLVGLGTVGAGTAKLLLEQGDRLELQAGRPLILARAVVRDLEKPRGVELPEGVLSTEIASIVNDKEISAVAELIGGLEPARSIILALLEAGKDVITANKALLAEHGPELFDRARELGRSIAFDAAVAGGIPIVTNISQCFSANQIVSIQAILNGTTNFILTQMESRGIDYADALAEAQRLGYAEADPTMDVDGADATQKLAILAHLAFGARIDWNDIPRTGIDQLNIADLMHAKELGYRVKLLSVAETTNGGLDLYVGPTLVKRGSPLAEVNAAYNAVSVVGDAVGQLFYEGLGAGQMPTASAVTADIIDTVVGRAAITFQSMEPWSGQRDRVAVRDADVLASRFYLRLNVEDRPGVLADIAGVLGNHQVSIESLIQHPGDDDGSGNARLVITTHETTEGAMRQAMAQVDGLGCTHGNGVRMKILDADHKRPSDK